ncbi:MAG: TrmB family transcriptional regulator [Candidatus Thermoplasmatota archaeon]|jgi:sugar-specific transcriptional regulator TrmB|nr:TrmB family transcriptional regulator [Candidatus Thermoplasmatota archaeon]
MEANTGQLDEISEMLKLLGMSSYEAQAFSALIYHGVANADTVADTARIPRTSAYKVMEALVQKGFAKETEGRPKMFRPVDLGKLRSEYQDRFDLLFKRLKELQDAVPSKGEPQLVYTIYGNQKVMAKMAEMVNLAEKELIICTPKVREIRTELKKNLEYAIKRGVKVIFVTPPNKRVPQDAEVYRKDGLIATDIVSDQSRAMLAGPDMDACGYTDNPALALHVYQFVRMIMQGEIR